MESQDDIFLKAREIADAVGQAAYLARACGEDAALRARVEAMLRDAEGAEVFFDGLSPLLSGDTQKTRVLSKLSESEGAIIGRYKLLQKIGEGGMGVVYMAEQREPVIRKAALKIIKLGMDTKQVVARFEAERQALALMDHPNIAKVLDGGATETGRPYFVMELVQGLPITQYCDEASLPTRERLKLFLDVCSAVQHAHQKGIIHRDLKPSNILVTLHGDKPVPKVIDFGVAKATQGRLTDKTVFTQFQHFIGTPAYMSPEQASLSGLDVDTRSDIYALGVLLYELLTGKTPFDPKELLRAGLDHMRQIILEEEPPKPSTRLGTLDGGDLTTTARRRQIDPPKLIHEVRGDLDWIVMKCLEKDRGQRYETANGLAADLQRHLADEPVVARPPSTLYRIEKAIRRNRIAFMTVTAIVTVLIIASVVSLWQAIRATRAEHEAKRQTETARNLKSDIDYDRNLYRDLWLARGYEGAGQTNEAIALMRDLYPRLAQSFPQHRDDCQGVARSLVRAGQYEDASAAYELIKKSFDDDLPGNPDDFAKWIEAIAATKGWANAAEACRNHFDLLPNEARAWRTKAMVFLYVDDQRFYARAATAALGLADTALNRADLVAVLETAGRGLSAPPPEETKVIMRVLQRVDPGIGVKPDPNAAAAVSAALFRLGRFEESLRPSQLASRWQNYAVDQSGSFALMALGSQRRGLSRQAYNQFLEAEKRTFGGSIGNLEALGQYNKFLNDSERYYLTLRRAALAEVPGAKLNSLARRGRWQEAAEEGARCIEQYPSNCLYYYATATVFVAMENDEGYRGLCQKIISRFAGATAFDDADLSAKLCSLLASSGVNRVAVSNLANASLFANRNNSDREAISKFTKGLVEYRQGHFASATNWTQEAIDYAATLGGGYAFAEARMILAMAQYQLQQTNDARQSLAKGIRLANLEEGRVSRDGDLSSEWMHIVRERALMKEARALIEGTK